MSKAEEIPSGPKLKMIAGRDSQGKSLEDLKGYSSTVVRQAFSGGEPIVVTGTDEGRALGSESAVIHNLRSIMAVPLKIRDKTMGVVYLDSQLAKGLFTRDDLDLLTAISNHIAIAFETSRMANIEAERRSLEKDIALVAAVQTLFLPKQRSFHSDGLSLTGYYHPASQASGDWWWYNYQESDKLLTVLLGDVTGHGAASAMITASTAGILQTLSRQYLSHSLEETLKRLNTEFVAIAQTEYSMTMGGIQLNAHTGKLTFFSAASPSLFILAADGTTRILHIAGTPLGTADFKLGRKESVLKPGDRLCMYTDGISEMALHGGGMMKTKKLMELLARTSGLKQPEAANLIIEELSRLRGSTPLQDDITFVLVDRDS